MNRKDAPRQLKKRDMNFKVESVDEEGRFTGYGSVFNVVDAYREVVAPGAFAESLERIKSDGRTLPALWNHNRDMPIGGYDKLAEDEHGLYVEGFLLTNDIPLAQHVYVNMQRGTVSGLSIGYYVEGESWNEKDRILTLTKIDLKEVSIVVFPANDDARIDVVKSILALGQVPTLREFEASLREQGFSRSVAAAIADSGYKQLVGQGDLCERAIGDFLSTLRADGGGAFTLPTYPARKTS